MGTNVRFLLWFSAGLLLVAPVAYSRHPDRDTYWIYLLDSPQLEPVQLPPEPGPAVEFERAAEAEAELDQGEIETLFAPRWHELGPITAEYVYTGESFGLVDGGTVGGHPTRYRGGFDLLVSLDTEKAQFWEGGLFQIYAFQTHGRTLTVPYVLDGQYYSNIDTQPKPADVTEIGECYYVHTFGDSGCSIKAGKLDANADFAYGDLCGDFVNSSFAMVPNVPMPAWPLQTLGVMALCEHSEWFRVGGGIYEGGRERNQFWFTTDDSSGIFALTQLELRPNAGTDGLPVTYRCGIWYKSADTLNLRNDDFHDCNYGIYVLADKMILPEEDPTQGLGGFAQYGWAPGDRNIAEHYVGCGLTYRGLLPRRDADMVGAGMVQVWFAEPLRELGMEMSETAIEAFYKMQLTPWASLQPDVQFISQPSGLAPDAFVAGLRYEVVL